MDTRDSKSKLKSMHGVSVATHGMKSVPQGTDDPKVDKSREARTEEQEFEEALRKNEISKAEKEKKEKDELEKNQQEQKQEQNPPKMSEEKKDEVKKEIERKEEQNGFKSPEKNSKEKDSEKQEPPRERRKPEIRERMQVSPKIGRPKTSEIAISMPATSPKGPPPPNPPPQAQPAPQPAQVPPQEQKPVSDRSEIQTSNVVSSVKAMKWLQRPEKAKNRPRKVFQTDPLPSHLIPSKYPTHDRVLSKEFPVDCILETRVIKDIEYRLVNWGGQWDHPRFICWEPKRRFPLDFHIEKSEEHRKKKLKECEDWCLKNSKECLLKGGPEEQRKKPELGKQKKFCTDFEGSP